VGRSNILTDAGQVVFGYAEEIFALGQELTNALHQPSSAKAVRFCVGVVDSFPKLITNEVLKPLFKMPQSVHLTCREGKLDDLLALLTAHRLDMVLTDEPPSSNANLKTFDHPLGATGTSFCAVKAVAARLKPGFPRSLNGAPALLPARNTPFRRTLETWFLDQRIKPSVTADFEDLALMKIVGGEGRGFMAIPTAVAVDACKRYGFQILGEAKNCRLRFYALTAERRIVHPAVEAIINAAKVLME
jgi:LysR family transcriptional activator of nhaA